MKVVLNLDEVLLVRGFLRHGFTRDRHPNWRAGASAAAVAFHDKERAKADKLLARLDARIERLTKR